MDERINYTGTTGLLLPAPQALPRPGSRIRAALSWVHMRRGFFLLAALLIAGCVAFSTLYYPTYVVAVNGVEIGQVAQKEQAETCIRRAEATVSRILGTPYQITAQPSYQYIHTYGNAYTSATAMEQNLLATVPELMQRYTLRVDGNLVGAAETQSALNTLLNRVKAPYKDETTVSVQLLGDVTIQKEYVPIDTQQDTSKMLQTLQSPQGTVRTHTAEPGDTLASIAARFGVLPETLAALNPDLTDAALSGRPAVVLEQAAPLLPVRVEKLVRREASIPFETTTVSDDTLYKGDRKVLTPGVNGVKLVTETQVFQNETLLRQTVLAETVTQEPVSQVVALGTKERPKTMATGSFLWPVSGRITSHFGYRRIFGSTSFHSGLDIACPHGTAIKAADGGTVTYTGYKGSYGNLVIIDHGNGKQTYYAHCSSILVSSGTKVAKGQAVARVGSTGRSTGNHLHFEVRVGGSAVNPLSYLPRG